MRLLTIAVAALLISGCATTRMPSAPAELMEPCPDALQTLDRDTGDLDKVLSVVVSNYGQYHECRIKMNAWIDWYNRQQAIDKKLK
jgi:hypothetical protein